MTPPLPPGCRCGLATWEWCPVHCKPRAHRQPGPEIATGVPGRVEEERRGDRAQVAPALIHETEWRRKVMGQAKDALACGDAQGAWDALTRHEDEGYPWAPGQPGNQGPPR